MGGFWLPILLPRKVSMPLVKGRICATEGCEKPARFRSTKCGTCANKKWHDRRAAERADKRAQNPRFFPREAILENVKNAILSMIDSDERWHTESITIARYRAHGGTYCEYWFQRDKRRMNDPDYIENHFNGWKEIVSLAMDRVKKERFKPDQTEMLFEYQDDNDEDYYYTESSIKVEYHPGIVECLRCGKMFESWDTKLNRICCKTYESSGEYRKDYLDDMEADSRTNQLWMPSGPGGRLEHYNMGW